MGFNWLSSKAETRKSHISGKGTFAKKNIKKGEIVAVFGGQVFDFTTWNKIPEDVKYEDLQIGEDLIIGPKKKEEVGKGDYVNHSCEPNAGINGQIFLVAMKGIKRDEEMKSPLLPWTKVHGFFVDFFRILPIIQHLKMLVF